MAKKKEKPMGTVRIPQSTRAGGSHKDKSKYTRKKKHRRKYND